MNFHERQVSALSQLMMNRGMSRFVLYINLSCPQFSFFCLDFCISNFSIYFAQDGPSRSARSSLGREEGTEKTDGEKELALVSEGEEDEDEDMLADCINIGMQNSRCVCSILQSFSSDVSVTSEGPFLYDFLLILQE